MLRKEGEAAFVALGDSFLRYWATRFEPLFEARLTISDGFIVFGLIKRLT